MPYKWSLEVWLKWLNQWSLSCFTIWNRVPMGNNTSKYFIHTCIIHDLFSSFSFPILGFKLTFISFLLSDFKDYYAAKSTVRASHGICVILVSGLSQFWEIQKSVFFYLEFNTYIEIFFLYVHPVSVVVCHIWWKK